MAKKPKKPKQLLANEPRSIRHFQQRYGLPVTGTLDAATRAAVAKRNRKLISHNAAQARRDDRNPLYNPGQILSGSNLRKATQAIVDAEIKPKLSALEEEGRQATAQGTALVDRNSDMYREIASREAQSVATQQAISTRLNQQVKQVDDESKAVLAGAQADAQKAIASSSVDVGAKGMLAAEMAAQTARQQSGSVAARTGAASQGANYEGLQNTLASARGLKGQEVGQQLANRMASQQQDVRSRTSALKGSAGDLFSKTLTGLRQSQFENRATVEGLGLKQADLQATVENQKANRDLAKGRLKETARHNTAQERRQQAKDKADMSKDAYQRKYGLGPYKPAAGKKGAKPKAEPQASKNLKLKIDNAVSSINRYRAAGWPGTRITKRALKEGVPPVVLNAARDLVYKGYLSGPNIAALRRAGVRIPRAWLTKPKYQGGPHGTGRN